MAERGAEAEGDVEAGEGQLFRYFSAISVFFAPKCCSFFFVFRRFVFFFCEKVALFPPVSNDFIASRNSGQGRLTLC